MRSDEYVTIDDDGMPEAPEELAATEVPVGVERPKKRRGMERSERFPQDKFYGPWAVDSETGQALKPQTIQFPPRLWRLLRDIAVLEERRGTSNLVRQAAVLYAIDAARRDPRIMQLVVQHGAEDMLGVAFDVEA